MLSKSLLKQIRSLELKKFRKQSGLFIAEGRKTVCDLLAQGMECEKIVATHDWLCSNPVVGVDVVEASEKEIESASFLRTPQGVIGIFRQRHEETDFDIPRHQLCLALDDVQDPGNLGTIVRIADWFGIEHIFCSPGTADIYNPKTVQATMGAIGRIHVHYTPLPELLAALNEKAPIYGTFLNGENIYAKELTPNGIIVMGNEGNGISSDCEQHIGERLFIPNHPVGRDTSESLNVSTATAIICAEFRRREACVK